MFRDALFFISEAIIGMRRSGIMIFISIATIAVSLSIFGIFLLISANINNLANFVSSKLEIRVYLKDGLTQEQMDSFRQRISSMKDVKSVEFVSKDTAWEQFKKNFSTLNLSELMEGNPLPDSFHVFLNENNQIPSMARYLNGFQDYVQDVQYMSVIAERIELFSRFVRLAGIILVGLLTIATLFITINTIRLTVIARQEEIAIMHLVGATHQFIRWPFIIEGLIMGSVGATVAIIFLKVSYTLFCLRIQNSAPYFPLLYDSFTLNLVYAGVAALGIFLGTVGAYISVSKTLKTTL